MHSPIALKAYVNYQEEALVNCPYCGEAIVLLIDPSVSHQSYIEDCEVCCRPIVIEVAALSRDEISVLVKQEDE